jgi:hypothetical protein
MPQILAWLAAYALLRDPNHLRYPCSTPPLAALSSAPCGARSRTPTSAPSFMGAVLWVQRESILAAKPALRAARRSKFS